MTNAWLTPDVVRQSAGLRQGTTLDEQALELAADAAAEYVEALHPELWVETTDVPPVRTYVPTAAVKLGAAMLAHRWYARRASPLGVAGYQELGAAGILRYDPDIARLLGIGTDGGSFVFGAPSLPVSEV